MYSVNTRRYTISTWFLLRKLLFHGPTLKSYDTTHHCSSLTLCGDMYIVQARCNDAGLNANVSGSSAKHTSVSSRDSLRSVIHLMYCREIMVVINNLTGARIQEFVRYMYVTQGAYERCEGVSNHASLR